MMRTRMNRVGEHALYAKVHSRLQLRCARLPLVSAAVPEQERVQDTGLFQPNIVYGLFLTPYTAYGNVVKSQIDKNEALFWVLRLPAVSATAVNNQKIPRTAGILRSKLRCDLRIAQSEIGT